MAMFNGCIRILGFGSIGSGLIPLLLKHFSPDKIKIMSGDGRNLHIAEQHGIEHLICKLDRDNYQNIIGSWINRGDFLVNLSVDVSSRALVEWCGENDVLYIDTCIEPWAGYYTDVEIPPEKRTNYALRQEILDMRANKEFTGPTAIMAHGANPGL
jgi:homospermidine synthase